MSNWITSVSYPLVAPIRMSVMRARSAVPPLVGEQASTGVWDGVGAAVGVVWAGVGVGADGDVGVGEVFAPPQAARRTATVARAFHMT
ncbi:MAG TPA: hypothetical protein VFD88_03950 [Clostridia bacterium]|nr:hypothetical protein [Clostridia bacterium]